jgi:hypothetical protein
MNQGVARCRCGPLRWATARTSTTPTPAGGSSGTAARWTTSRSSGTLLPTPTSAPGDRPLLDAGAGVHPGRPHVPVQHRTQLRRAPVHDRRAVRQGLGEPERRRLGLRCQAGCARPPPGTERDRPCPASIPASTTRPWRTCWTRKRHHLALLRARPRHRPVLPALRVPGDPPHPLRPGLARYKSRRRRPRCSPTLPTASSRR